MSKFKQLRKSDKHLSIPDFREVVERLRKLTETFYISKAGEAETLAVQGAMLSAEHEWAVQCVEGLYSHLTHYEQWRSAAYLMAYCMPAIVANDPRIVDLREHCLGLAEKMKDPETERAGYFLEHIQLLDDRYMMDQTSVSPRARYMLRAARLARCKSVLEYATGAGANVIHSKMTYPSIEWAGMDISQKQMLACQEQADRLKVGVQFRAHEFPEWFGKFDAVAVMDTLEHTAFPHELLEEAEKYIKPDGLVIFSVPNGPWSPFTHNKRNLELAGAGQHIAVSVPGEMSAMLGSRGSLLHMEIIQGGPAQGNSNVAGVYEKFEN
jgi:2-polyprenyl-3-methyl-5-hydroxy-6-metoxy-1,4-benzoquinol methylase